MNTQTSEANAVLEVEYPMLLIGRDHRVSYANSHAHKLFGYDHGALHGASVEQLLAPARRAEVRNVQAVLRGQTSRRWRSIVREAKGALVDVNLSLEPCLDDRGSVIAVKVRCDRVARSQQPPPSFEAVSGTRPIPLNGPRPLVSTSVRAVPPPLDRRIPPSDRPFPSLSDRPGRAKSLPPSSPISERRIVLERPATPKTVPPAQTSAARPAARVSERPLSPQSEPPTAAYIAPAPTLSEPPTVTYEVPPQELEIERKLSAQSKAPSAFSSARPSAPKSERKLSALSEAPSAFSSARPSAPKSERKLSALSRPPTATSSAPPPAPKSERKLSVMPALDELPSGNGAEQLETALQLLVWLRQRIEATDGPLADVRERARALVVLNETTELVAQCRCEWKRD